MKRSRITAAFLAFVVLFIGGVAILSNDVNAQVIMGDSRVEKISDEWTFNPYF